MCQEGIGTSNKDVAGSKGDGVMGLIGPRAQGTRQIWSSIAHLNMNTTLSKA